MGLLLYCLVRCLVANWLLVVFVGVCFGVWRGFGCGYAGCGLAVWCVFCGLLLSLGGLWLFAVVLFGVLLGWLLWFDLLLVGALVWLIVLACFLDLNVRMLDCLVLLIVLICLFVAVGLFMYV